MLCKTALSTYTRIQFPCKILGLDYCKLRLLYMVMHAHSLQFFMMINSKELNAVLRNPNPC